MKYTDKIVPVAIMLLLASCSSSDQSRPVSTGDYAPNAVDGAVSDTPVKIGSPFTVAGKTYKPEDVANYDDVGYASWYGAELEGRPTANGEIFAAGSISGAHKTLPMPSYVEVTALDTGRTILVRLNDRGPFANDRLIDLSEGAARALGIQGQGVAGVRVRKVNPPEFERATLRAGRPASTRIDTPESLLKVLREKLVSLPRPSNVSKPTSMPTVTPSRNPAVRPPVTNSPVGVKPDPVRPVESGNGRFVREGQGQSTTVPPTTHSTQPSSVAPIASGYVVQIASYSSRARADDLAHKLGAHVFASVDGKVFRVRFGPYKTEVEAQASLAKAKAKGYPQARVFAE